MVKKLLRSILMITTLAVTLAAGLATTVGPAAAASVNLATNNGVTYAFTKSVHSPAFSNSKSGYVKIALQRSCATSNGSFVVRLQKRVGSNWVVQTGSQRIWCTTSRSSVNQDFEYSKSGTYRIQFYSLTGTSQKRIHYWGVYRSDTP